MTSRNHSPRTRGMKFSTFMCIFVGLCVASCAYQGGVSKRSNHSKKYRSVTTKEDKLRADIVKEAYKQIGKRYRYGGKTPKSGFDCSGLSTYVYGQAGISISGASSTLSKKGKFTSKRNAKPGDLAFFGSKNKVTHVGVIVYCDGSRMDVIHATSKGGVRKDDVFSSEYWRSRYLFSRSLVK